MCIRLNAAPVVLFNLRKVLLNVLCDVVEGEHTSCFVILGRCWVSEALRCLGLRLQIDCMLLVDKLVLLSVRDIVI